MVLSADVKIVADENIPQVESAFKDLGEVMLLPGRAITQRDLEGCDCLLVRTVTNVNRHILENTPVKFVGSATIGTDHIDLPYLHEQQTGFSNAAGCNAEAASEYVISGLFALSQRKGFNPFDLKAGIIGCGNVGSRLFQKLQTLGIETLRNDPPLAQQSPEAGFVDIETIIGECNFISLHVPLTRDDPHATEHLFNHDRLSRLQSNCLLVNAARGPVIDNQALLNIFKERNDLCIFLDTWENEPNISRELLSKVDLATPHIAGYSVEGRLRGTQMILNAACQHFDKNSQWHFSKNLPDLLTLEVGESKGDLGFWQRLFGRHHDIWQDHQALTQAAPLNDDDFAKHFDSLRKVYPNRFEYERYRLTGAQKKAAAMARRLLFKV